MEQRRSPGEDRAIAHHEAGHIVATRMLDVRMEKVSMCPTNDTNEAEVASHSVVWATRNADRSVQLEALETEAKIALAGPFAQLRHEPCETETKKLREANCTAMRSEWKKDIKDARLLVIKAVRLNADTTSSLSDFEIGEVRADPAECERLYARFCNETEALITAEWCAIKRVADWLERHRTITQTKADKLIFR